MGLKANKPPGPDHLHLRILKEVAMEILNVLIIIFRNCVDSGTAPADWRVAHITPLFKKEGG